MEPTWGPPGSCRPQMGPMLTPWTLLSGMCLCTLMVYKTRLSQSQTWCNSSQTIPLKSIHELRSTSVDVVQHCDWITSAKSLKSFCQMGFSNLASVSEYYSFSEQINISALKLKQLNSYICERNCILRCKTFTFRNKNSHKIPIWNTSDILSCNSTDS